ncbi:hypothetical protein ACGFJ7_19520 [Actinoplanes sp. NPDC048988]|uniref:hypothetical protein n=1 Tax=Actinoplanes sp. NPDC048988 TaxID=3363901 RepID=UPI00371DD8C2
MFRRRHPLHYEAGGKADIWFVDEPERQLDLAGTWRRAAILVVKDGRSPWGQPAERLAVRRRIAIVAVE